MQNNLAPLINLTMNKGGPGDLQYNLQESPSTQVYHSIAAQNNPDFAQVIGDLHRSGDINDANFNLLSPLFTTGLRNDYIEKQNEKEFQRDLLKLEKAHQYNKEMQKIATDNDIAKLKLANQFNIDQENRKKALFDELELRRASQNAKPIQSLNKYNRTLNVIPLMGENYNIYRETPFDINKYTKDNDLINFFNNNGQDFIQLGNKINNARLNNTDNSKIGYYDNLVESYNSALKSFNENMKNDFINNKRLQDYTSFSNLSNEQLMNVADLVAKYTGNEDNLGFRAKFMEQFRKQGKLPEDNRLFNYLLATNSGFIPRSEYYKPEIASFVQSINKLSPEDMQKFGFNNTNGMQDKALLYDPTTQSLLIYEVGSDKLQRFSIGYNRESGNYDYIDNGFVNLESNTTNDFKKPGIINNTLSNLGMIFGGTTGKAIDIVKNSENYLPKSNQNNENVNIPTDGIPGVIQYDKKALQNFVNNASTKIKNIINKNSNKNFEQNLNNYSMIDALSGKSLPQSSNNEQLENTIGNFLLETLFYPENNNNFNSYIDNLANKNQKHVENSIDLAKFMFTKDKTYIDNIRNRQNTNQTLINPNNNYQTPINNNKNYQTPINNNKNYINNEENENKKLLDVLTLSNILFPYSIKERKPNDLFQYIYKLFYKE